MFSRKKQPPIKSLIAQGTRIEGHVLFADGLRVDGEVIGDIRVQQADRPSMLVISETAVVHGSIRADHVIVNGRIVGPVHATELLELQPKANIEGDVVYQALEMHQGAVIAGQLRPLPGAVAATVAAPVTPALEEKPVLKLASNQG